MDVKRSAIPPELIVLCGRTWSLPVLAHLHGFEGARYVELLHATGASRGSLSDTLKSLGRLGMVTPNPGYGHPLRPEYMLTPAGSGVARASAAVLESADRLRMQRRLLLRKWSLPIFLALGPETLRFGQVRARLGHPTPRAVSLGLRDLASVRWIDRRLIDQSPPVADYTLATRARPLLRPLRRLASAATA